MPDPGSRPVPDRWGPGAHDVATLTAAERRAFDDIERSRPGSDERPPRPAGRSGVGPGSPIVEHLCLQLTVATAAATVGLLLLVTGALVAVWVVAAGAVVLGAGLALLVPAAVAARRLVAGT